MSSEQRQARPVLGVFWMVVTGLLFVGVTALVKYLGPGIPAPEAAFLRYAIGLVFLIPLIRPILATRLTRRHWSLFTIRGLSHSIGVALWFYAMARIPIADVTAMNYLAPIYVTLGAAVFLGEKLAARRVVAVVVALIGALIILRPGFREIGPGHLAMLGAAVVFGASYLLAKLLTDETNAAIVVGMLSIWVTVGLAPMAIAVWVPPTAEALVVLTMVALLATAGHYTMTLAFAAAPVTVTQPVSFLQLVWAVSLGALFFDEGVDIWVVIGGLVILGSVTFITWREAMLKRRLVTPPAPATKV
ncbi:MAG: DMT family transporter [Paracoccaceae bacterium]|uniref:DMT family transporter n=1 Tax=unclassified Seohaeicola TaxID=2641111 RepID=UPI00237B9901|nr:MULTISPECIES: DMT family transporter [unclassified Seohaeicola]MDD9708089.1 DMT family transporter [Seohaeicola sp. 4SK31]MDD9736053.1 DMT family transporter [Seohaeicola sp. SP36]MDF1707414.1 DMT family transporter [Paracoccaceae bacterium]MDM7968874.1 DMT family transporter [Paracoccaceae bacterium]